uniref:Fatty acid amide hydrolase 2b n=1 Tax=Astyanax mexicanus TaxID=7994 RepID=A0A8B9HQ41_ASTMX
MGLTVGEMLQKGLFRAVSGFFFLLFRLFSRPVPPKAAKLPPVKNPLLTVPAVRLAEKIRRREVTSVDVVQAFIDRIQEVNPLLNAMVKDRFSAALSEAAHVDRLIEEEGRCEEALADRLPLLGVPMSVKESFFLQGMPCSTGLISRARFLASGDAPSLALLKRAGAIPLGVTNTPELCMWMESSNNVYGITNNPYDLQRMCGGSSGGEGSILGSGGAVIGIGSDIGGSIRMPSFFNGVFGHKGTTGIVSNHGQHPVISGRHDEYVSTGPMCRYAEDLLPMLRIMAGADADKLCLSTEVDLKKLRFFTVVDDSGSPLTSPVDKQLVEAQRKVRVSSKYSAILAEYLIVSSNIFKDKDSCFLSAKLILFFVCTTSGLAIVESTKSATPSQFLIQQKEELQRNIEEVLGSDGVLLYPAHPFLAQKHHHPLFTPYNMAYTGIFNVLGLPVTQCPLGLSKEGLPLGVQVVAGKLQDRLTLAMALYLQKAFGGWRDPGAT